MRRILVGNQGGFTLVELFISTAMITVLAGLAVGLVFEYRDRSFTIELGLLQHDFNNSAFVLMNTMPLDDGTTPTCIFLYNTNVGHLDLGCDSLTGDNTYLDIFDMKDRPLYLYTEFVSNAAFGGDGWQTWTVMLHCDISEQNNTISYGFSSNNVANWEVSYFEPPADPFHQSAC